MFPENPLQLYGTPLEVYQGKGKLTFSSKRKIDCQFIAAQLENGKTFMLCATSSLPLAYRFGVATPTLFEGTTHEGYQIEVDHIVSETEYLSETVAGEYLALRVGHLRVCRRAPYSRKHLTFLLANLDGIHSEISFSYRSLTFALQSIENSSRNLARLKVLRSVLPTAQLQVTTRASLERVSEAVDELCYLLSIALGTKSNGSLSLKQLAHVLGYANITTHVSQSATAASMPLTPVAQTLAPSFSALRMAGSHGRKGNPA